jgi:hypothetical protein
MCEACPGVRSYVGLLRGGSGEVVVVGGRLETAKAGQKGAGLPVTPRPRAGPQTSHPRRGKPKEVSERRSSSSSSSSGSSSMVATAEVAMRTFPVPRWRVPRRARRIQPRPRAARRPCVPPFAALLARLQSPPGAVPPASTAASSPRRRSAHLAPLPRPSATRPSDRRSGARVGRGGRRGKLLLPGAGKSA